MLPQSLVHNKHLVTGTYCSNVDSLEWATLDKGEGAPGE